MVMILSLFAEKQGTLLLICDLFELMNAFSKVCDKISIQDHEAS